MRKPQYNQTQTAALELLRARLDLLHPMFAGAPEVEAALSGEARLYFTTWVLPLVDFLMNGESYFGESHDIKRQHADRAGAARSRAQWLEWEEQRRART